MGPQGNRTWPWISGLLVPAGRCGEVRDPAGGSSGSDAIQAGTPKPTGTMLRKGQSSNARRWKGVWKGEDDEGVHPVATKFSEESSPRPTSGHPTIKDHELKQNVASSSIKSHQVISERRICGSL
ncbi:hypothetical protein DB88DRAFT_545756 [Papiliotrema laurentii]|uniref:Uncharacterized protein n=1 Tax=Papiliotrema laurentii TaxID=5418 RepID=A0AAD9FRJ3_PAPLA|nr:hypothetical protein DB88DRAFT_545756 [Papiliotrema laurentii]